MFALANKFRIYESEKNANSKHISLFAITLEMSARNNAAQQLAIYTLTQSCN